MMVVVRSASYGSHCRQSTRTSLREKRLDHARRAGQKRAHACRSWLSAGLPSSSEDAGTATKRSDAWRYDVPPERGGTSVHAPVPGHDQDRVAEQERPLAYAVVDSCPSSRLDYGNYEATDGSSHNDAFHEIRSVVPFWHLAGNIARRLCNQLLPLLHFASVAMTIQNRRRS